MSKLSTITIVVETCPETGHGMGASGATVEEARCNLMADLLSIGASESLTRRIETALSGGRDWRKG